MSRAASSTILGGEGVGHRARRCRIAGVLIAIVTVLFGSAAVARAASVQVVFDHQDNTSGHDGGPVSYYFLRYVTAPGEANDATMTNLGGFPSRWRVHDSGAPLTPGPGCQVDGADLLCGPPVVPSVLDGQVALGDGNDRLVLDRAPAVVVGGSGDDRVETHAALVTVVGGAGADELVGDVAGSTFSYADRIASVFVTMDGQPNDGEAGEGDNVPSGTRVQGGSGADVLQGGSLYGGPGNDLLIAGPAGGGLVGEAGNDMLIGGNGNDMLDGGPGSDLIRGGAGRDTVDYSLTRNGTSYGPRLEPLTVTLDDQPGDGAAGENDNIGSDVEVLIGGYGNDVLVGNDAANRISGSLGNDTIRGRGGDDTLVGGPGSDTLDGGAGRDVLFTEGRDTVLAKDGEPDRVECEGGAPRAFLVDRVDTLRCVVAARFPGSHRLRMSRHGTIRLRVACPASPGLSCEGSFDLSELHGKRVGARLAHGRFKLLAGATKRVAVRISRAGRRTVIKRRALTAYALILDHATPAALLPAGSGLVQAHTFRLLAPPRN